MAMYVKSSVHLKGYCFLRVMMVMVGDEMGDIYHCYRIEMHRLSPLSLSLSVLMGTFAD